MNFYHNGVKIYGNDGETKYSLDTDSSDSELDETILVRYCNPSPPPDHVDEYPKKKPTNIRKFFPKSLLDQVFVPSIPIGVTIKEEPQSPPSDKTEFQKRGLLSPRIDEIRKKMCMVEIGLELQGEREINPISSFLPHETQMKITEPLNSKIPNHSPQQVSQSTVKSSQIAEQQLGVVSNSGSDQSSNAPLPEIKIKTEPPESEEDIKKEVYPAVELDRIIKSEFPYDDNIKYITERINFPCVGLDYVYEIERINPLHDIVFRCDLCSAKCGHRTILLHLRSFKHYLRCLRKYNPHIYERFRYKKKSHISEIVEDYISKLEKEIGRGEIKLRPSGYECPQKPQSDSSSEESNYTSKTRNDSKGSYKAFDRENHSNYYSSSHHIKKESYSSSPSTSHHTHSRYDSSYASTSASTSRSWPEKEDRVQSKSYIKSETTDSKKPSAAVKPKIKQEHDDSTDYINHVLPDKSRADFYCPLCDSHMSSAIIWESHIVGKRHRKNLKKQPGERPSKIKAVKRNDIEALLYKDLEEIDDAIVGLDYITENLKAVKGIGPTYACYLCSGSLTRLNIVDHLKSTKHRLKYMQKVDAEKYGLIDAQNFTKGTLENVVQVEAYELEKRFGRGKLEVRLEVLND